MTTNEIEKQLTRKAQNQISEEAQKIVDSLSMFSTDHTGVNRSGLHWYSKRVKPHKQYTSDPELIHSSHSDRMDLLAQDH